MHRVKTRVALFPRAAVQRYMRVVSHVLPILYPKRCSDMRQGLHKFFILQIAGNTTSRARI